jgi:dTDP-4-dehydrorhamnose 3,5-epimerase
MNKVETGFEGLYILEPRVFKDHRGYFLETHNDRTLKSLGLNYNFVQDNESFSQYGTVRGMHFQTGNFAQTKLVRVIKGVVQDVVVDVRPKSPTFGKSFSSVISDEDKRMILIPRGFAHGFAVLSESAVFSYKCDNFYSAEHESGLHFADPDLGIEWQIPEDKRILSDKDKLNPKLRDLAGRL